MGRWRERGGWALTTGETTKGRVWLFVVSFALLSFMRLSFDYFIILGSFNQKLHSRYERDVPAVSKEAVTVPLARVPSCGRESSRKSRLASFFKRLWSYIKGFDRKEARTSLSSQFLFLELENLTWMLTEKHLVWVKSLRFCVCVCLVNPTNFFCNRDRESSRIYCSDVSSKAHLL